MLFGKWVAWKRAKEANTHTVVECSACTVSVSSSHSAAHHKKTRHFWWVNGAKRNLMQTYLIFSAEYRRWGQPLSQPHSQTVMHLHTRARGWGCFSLRLYLMVHGRTTLFQICHRVPRPSLFDCLQYVYSQAFLGSWPSLVYVFRLLAVRILQRNTVIQYVQIYSSLGVWLTHLGVGQL